ncbi:MAG: hypothetical protein ACI8SK_000867 [Shewanella sp.]|jgi:hypothetical protein
MNQKDVNNSGVENDEQTDSMLCPLCQTSNKCALTTNQEIEACWCMTAKFPPKPALLEKQLDGNSCICQDCLNKMKEELALGLKRI